MTPDTTGDPDFLPEKPGLAISEGAGGQIGIDVVCEQKTGVSGA